MGGCVTPAKPKYSTIKQVQIKEGSAVTPLSNSAIRYVNPNGSLGPAPIIDQTNSQIRRLGDTNFNPRSSILRPTTPPIAGLGPDGRPSVQSVLPLGSVGSMHESGYPQRPSIEPPMMIPGPGLSQMGLPPIGINQNNIRPMSSHIPSAEPFSIHPTSVPMVGPNGSIVQTIERNSANIPLPGPPSNYGYDRIPQSEQIRTETTTFRQDSRPVSPALVHPPIMSSALNKTIQEINITQNYPSNVPRNGPGNIPSGVVRNQYVSTQINTPVAPLNNLPPNTPPSNMESLRLTPTISQYPQSSPSSNNSQYPGSNNQIKDSVLPIQSRGNDSPPRIIATPPPPRPLTPLQPTINFDRRLLNFDRAMFSTETKTPQLNSFTYNLDLPISGQNKVKYL